MTDADWLTGTHPADLLGAVRGRVSHRKLRLLAVACCRRLGCDFVEPDRTRLLAAEVVADGGPMARELAEAHGIESSPAALDGPVAVRYFAGEATAALGWPDPRPPAPPRWRPFRRSRPPFDPAARAEGHTTWVLHLAALVASLRVDDERLGYAAEQAAQADLVRCVVPNPFRPVAFDPNWRTTTAVALARPMYDARDFAALPVLADALQDAGCDHPDILAHGRGPGPHARGCWVVDEVLGLS